METGRFGVLQVLTHTQIGLQGVAVLQNWPIKVPKRGGDLPPNEENQTTETVKRMQRPREDGGLYVWLLGC